MPNRETEFELPGKVRIAWNEETGIVCADLKGFWTVEDALAFYPAMIRAAERSRRRHGGARLLFDTRQSPVQNNGILEQPGKETLIAPSDRVAVVVESSLLKMQLRRRTQLSEDVRYFSDPGEAEAWLRA